MQLIEEIIAVKIPHKFIKGERKEDVRKMEERSNNLWLRMAPGPGIALAPTRLSRKKITTQSTKLFFFLFFLM